MKASELVKELEENIKEHGDSPIAIDITNWSEHLDTCYSPFICLIVENRDSQTFFTISGDNY